MIRLPSINRKQIKEIIKKFFSVKEKPSKIALSSALGIFIGLVVPLGFQTLAAAPLSILFRCNFIITEVFTFISNPLTVIPLYFIAFKIGGIFISKGGKWDNILLFIGDPSLHNLVNLRDEAFKLFIGSVLMAIFVSVLIYILTYLILSIYRKRREGFQY